DDLDMRISHVIRGADHLSNTSKHVLLYQALQAPLPLFAHLPMILGPDRKRLSKRHGATSVTEYSQKGLLPVAVRNYLALLGWSPGDDAELLAGDELIDRFDLSRVNKADAVFDLSKLEWMNKRYLSSISAAELEPLLRPILEEEGLWRSSWETAERAELLGVIDLLKTRVGSLRDFPDYGRAFFTDDFSYADDAVERYLSAGEPEGRERLVGALRDLRNAYATLSPFDLESTERILREIAGERQLKAGQLIGAVRVATTGRAQAPGLFDVLVTLGRPKTLERLDRVIETLSHV
ncbi:MAG: glutamate--tRNA ligase family protein, partial [Acidobacteriota bacterium]